MTVSSGVAVAAKSTSTTAGDHVGVFNLVADGGTNNAGLNVVSAKTHSLCDDAKAWNKEARRRVAYYRANRCASDGDRIKILGRDVDGKTDDLAGILVEVDTEFSRINGSADLSFTARLIAPLPSDDDAEEDVLTKNGSSTILGISMTSDWVEAARYLIGGDAEVGVWERVWDRNKERKHVLEYDVLIAPHHCSWHGLSWDSWSDCGEDAEVSKDARSALGQARPGAKIIASSKPVADDDNDPPCVRAKREYESILRSPKGKFVCIGDGDDDSPYDLEITSGGTSLKKAYAAAAAFHFVENAMKELHAGRTRTFTEFKVPDEAIGCGFHEAVRGVLSHHVVIRDGKIANYHPYPPTPWNAAPRDSYGTPGPYEDAVQNTPIFEENGPDKFKGIDIMRTVRSFDPCLPCGVHMYLGDGKEIQVRHAPMFGVQK